MLAGRYKGIIVIAVLLGAGLAWGFWPRPVLVETDEVARRPLQVTVEEEGRTRVKERYALHAPVAGYLRRVELEVGDPVTAGQPLAVIDPLPSAMLDPRTRAEAEARAAAARSGLVRAEKMLRQAESEAELAADEFARRAELLARQLVPRAEYDQAQSRKRAMEAAAQAAASAVDVARHELEAAEATLRYAGAAASGAEAGPIEVVSPVDGRLLKRMQESAAVVASGQPLLEVGDPQALEVEVEVLSRDAVRIEPGGRVLFERWGGEQALEGRVRTVEPTGFTKVSALGVEEQRVLVIADFAAPAELWRRLGDGYRVEARFITWEREDALTVPAGALFRRGDDWAAFVVRDGRARLVNVRTGQGSGLLTEVLDGLEAGERVVVHPGDELEDGMRVERYGADAG
ncbi:HlyD family efflux transporter periplasmic adaptor subunit [Thioalkalivibrio sp. XN8]|uniref:efflux RND transporter periplasmic adaptor subunit n=1 Tax=Thioalkalivibrio sp. XN8 TaxID=2712863 RepID=UPI003211E19F